MRSLRPVLIAFVVLSASESWLAATELRHGQVRIHKCLPVCEERESVLGFSVDGKRLLTAGGESFAVWDVKSGRKVARIRGEGKRAYLAAFLPDGKTVIACFWGEKEILIFDVESGRFSSRIPQPEAVEGLAVAPDGKTLVSYCVGKGMRLWEIKSRKELRRLRPSATPKWGGYGTGLVFSPDGKLIAAPVSDESVHLLDVASGEEVRRLFRKTEISFVPPIAFSPDGRFLAAFAQEFIPRGEVPEFSRSFIRLWDVHSGEVVREFRRPDPPQPSSADGEEWKKFRAEIGWFSYGLAFSPDGKTLANAYFWRTQLWEVATGRLRKEFSASTRTPCFSPNGALLVAATISLDPKVSTQVHLWDWRNSCPKQGESLSFHNLDRLWGELASDNAAVGYQAIATLLAHPGQGIALLTERLRRVEPVAPDEWNRLIANLDDDSFAVRVRTCERLAALGEAARPILLRVKAQRPSLEVRRRIEDLSPRLSLAGTPGRLRCLRAVEVLETIGTEEARRVLKKLASGAEGTAETEGAKETLKRLNVGKHAE